jgi:hypothetical protein
MSGMLKIDPGAREYYITLLNLSPKGKDQRTAKCPFHQDKSASLSLNLATGVWTCHAGCGSGNRVTFAAKLNGGTPRTQTPAKSSPRISVMSRSAPTTTYYYTDRNGSVIFRKLRFEQPDGKKTFRCEARNGEGWDRDLSRLTNSGVSMPLYNFAAMVRAEATTLVHAEGEKDVDNLKLVLPPTHVPFTNYEGGTTNKWHPEYDDLVRGKHVIICENNDEVGRAHASFWATSCLLAGAASVKIDSYAEELEEKGDVSDYLERNPRASLPKRWKQLPPWQSPEQQRFLTNPEFLARLPEKVEWIWEGSIPRASAVLFTGQNKIGKSTFTHCLVRARSQGRPYLERKTKAGRTLYLTEMSAEDLKAEYADCPGLGEEQNVSVITQNDCYDWGWEATLQQAFMRCQATGVDLLVVDTFNSWTLLENQNDAGQTLGAYHHLRKFMDAGIAVLIEDHEGIEQRDVGSARRGSTALTGQVSVVMSLRKLKGNHGEGTTFRALIRTGRHGVSDETIEWRDNDYHFIGTSAAVKSDDARKKIADILPREEKAALRLSDIVKLAGVARTTAQGALEKLVQSGMVEKCVKKQKEVSPKNPWHYWIK